MIGRIARNVVSQANGSQGDEAVVEGVQVVPVRLQGCKHDCWNQQEETYVARGNDEQVEHPYVERLTNKRT